jgi:threonine/homoserine/homoserine lactone efflux protein
MLRPDFLLTAFLVILVPGTGVIYTVSTGLTRGAAASLWAVLGCTFGIVPHLAASILGLSAILHMSSVAFQVIRFAGVAYLLYLSWTLWRSTGDFGLGAAQSGTESVAGARIALRGFLINILNPRLSIFFFAFLPQFIPESLLTPTREMLLLGAVFMVLTAVVFLCYGLLSSALSRFVRRSPGILTWVRRSFAAIIALFAIRLAVAVDE